MHLEHTGSPGRRKGGIATMAELVVASNRGPVQFEIDEDGNLSSGRGAGGMVTALGPALAGQGGTWVAAAINDGDRVAARRVARSGRLRTIELAQGPVRLRSLVFDPREYQGYYNRVANRTIWFLHHYLFDVPRHPRFDRGFRVAWQHYEGVNQAFAAACDDQADHGGEVFVQDYHLVLVPAMLRQFRGSGGAGGHQHRKSLVAQVLDQRQHGGDFADAGAMHPDQAPRGTRNAGLAAPFVQAGGVFFSAPEPVGEKQRGQRRRRRCQDTIEPQRCRQAVMHGGRVPAAGRPEHRRGRSRH